MARGEGMIVGQGERLKTLDGGAVINKIMSRIPEDTLRGKRLLIVCEDDTRNTPIHESFPGLKKRFDQAGVAEMTVVFAVGTHTKLDRAKMLKKLGLSEEEASGIKMLNHNPDAQDLIRVGKLEGQPLEVNSEIGEADTIISLNNCLPHKIPGFTGGSKMMFPGVSGRRFIQYFHGPRRGDIPDRNMEGKIDNSIRRLFDKATDKLQHFFPKKKFISVSYVTSPEGGVADVFIGNFKQSYQEAAKLSKEIYVKEIEGRPDMIVANIDPNKKDLWQAMQALYNCAGVLADNGTIIISGELASAIGGSHWDEIQAFGGYTTQEELKKRMESGKSIDGTVFSHMMRVGEFLSRGIRVIISSPNLSEDYCREMGLGYIAPDQLDQQNADIIVHHATDFLLLQKEPAI